MSYMLNFLRREEFVKLKFLNLGNGGYFLMFTIPLVSFIRRQAKLI